MNKEILSAYVAGAAACRVEDVTMDGDTIVIANTNLVSLCNMNSIADALKRADIAYGKSFIYEYLPETGSSRLCIPEVKI
jgi:hypothetical protein